MVKNLQYQNIFLYLAQFYLINLDESLLIMLFQLLIGQQDCVLRDSLLVPREQELLLEAQQI